MHHVVIESADYQERKKLDNQRMSGNFLAQAKYQNLSSLGVVGLESVPFVHRDVLMLGLGIPTMKV